MRKAQSHQRVDGTCVLVPSRRQAERVREIESGDRATQPRIAAPIAPLQAVQCQRAPPEAIEQREHFLVGLLSIETRKGEFKDRSVEHRLAG